MRRTLLSTALLLGVSINGAFAQSSVSTPVNTGPSTSFPGWTYHDVTDNSNSVYSGSNGGDPAPDYILKSSTDPWIVGNPGDGGGGVIWSPAFILTVPANTTISPSGVTGSVTYNQYGGYANNIIGYISTSPATSAQLLALGDWYNIYNVEYNGESAKSPNEFMLTQGAGNAYASNWNSSTSTGTFNNAYPKSKITSYLKNTTDSSVTLYIYLGLANSTGAIKGNEIDNIQFTLSSTTGSVTLPVGYASQLTAFVQGSSVALNWATATEINNKGFHVQRSKDGKAFTNIGFVASQAANGNSAKTLSYTYTDAMPLQGRNYYRLVQEDLDGHTASSGIVDVDFYGVKGGLTVYPNPTHGIVTIAGLQAGGNVVIYSANGQVVKHFTAASASQQVDISGLAAGIYFVKVLNRNGNTSTSFVVK